MSLSMYEASVPIFLRGLNRLSAFLDKAVAEGLDEAAILEARLYDDMRPFPDQIRMAAFSARGCVARLAGIDWPRTADDEADLDALKATIRLTTDFLQGVRPEQLEGSESRDIVVNTPVAALHFTGAGYLTSFALPNFHFHVTVAYAILRHLGAPLGKRDYLGQLELSRPPVPIGG